MYLLSRRSGHQPAAWRRLIENSSPLVHAWCRRGGIDPSDAGDVTQEVFIAVWRGMDAFRHDRAGAAFLAWLRGITRHKIADHFRDLARQPGTDDRCGVEAEFQVVTEGDDFTDTQHRLRGVLRQAMEDVSVEFEPRTWEGFLRVVGGDQSASEVGTQLGMTSGAVRQAKHKVLRRLREKVRDAA